MLAVAASPTAKGLAVSGTTGTTSANLCASTGDGSGAAIAGLPSATVVVVEPMSEGVGSTDFDFFGRGGLVESSTVAGIVGTELEGAALGVGEPAGDSTGSDVGLAESGPGASLARRALAALASISAMADDLTISSAFVAAPLASPNIRAASTRAWLSACSAAACALPMALAVPIANLARASFAAATCWLVAASSFDQSPADFAILSAIACNRSLSEVRKVSSSFSISSFSASEAIEIPA